MSGSEFRKFIDSLDLSDFYVREAMTRSTGDVFVYGDWAPVWRFDWRTWARFMIAYLVAYYLGLRVRSWILDKIRQDKTR